MGVLLFESLKNLLLSIFHMTLMDSGRDVLFQRERSCIFLRDFIKYKNGFTRVKAAKVIGDAHQEFSYKHKGPYCYFLQLDPCWNGNSQVNLYDTIIFVS